MESPPRLKPRTPNGSKRALPRSFFHGYNRDDVRSRATTRPFCDPQASNLATPHPKGQHPCKPQAQPANSRRWYTPSAHSVFGGLNICCSLLLAILEGILLLTMPPPPPAGRPALPRVWQGFRGGSAARSQSPGCRGACVLETLWQQLVNA